MTLRALAHLPSVEIRVGALTARLAEPGDACARELAALLAAAARGDAEARLVAISVIVWRARTDAGLHADYRARCAGAPHAARLFDPAPPARALSSHYRIEPALAGRRVLPEFRQRRVWRAADAQGGCAQGLETVGAHRRRLASVVVPRMLLGVDDDTVRRLLGEPLVQAELVVQLANHRPISVDRVMLVAASSRWLAYADVRRALASNPYAPPWLLYGLAYTLPAAHSPP